jgi:L-lactate dehydrogenase (cytochrome)
MCCNSLHPPKPTLASMINPGRKPRWCLGMLGTQRRASSATIFSHVKGIENMGSLSDGQFDPALTWAEN